MTLALNPAYAACLPNWKKSGVYLKFFASSGKLRLSDQVQLRRFALAFIHSHSGATDVFRNAFMELVAEATSCYTKNTADDIGSFTAVCVVGVLGALNCEYRQTFVFAMCGIVTFLM